MFSTHFERLRKLTSIRMLVQVLGSKHSMNRFPNVVVHAANTLSNPENQDFAKFVKNVTEQPRKHKHEKLQM